MYEPRLYREKMNADRFRGFRVVVGESDLWIGVNPENLDTVMETAAEKFLVETRKVLEDYIAHFPEFRDSFEPLPLFGNEPAIISGMKEAAIAAGTGPMAAVAGMVAGETGKYLTGKFGIPEIVVENGGDIYIHICRPLVMSIEAGSNKHFSNIGLVIPPDMTPAGICTSSGMFGHSVSLGRADSVTVVTPSACLADAFATGIANRINSADDIGPVVESSFTEDMISLVCIKDEQIGIKGLLPIERIG